MKNQKKEKQTKAPNIRSIVVSALEKYTISLHKDNKQFSDKQIAELSYDFVLNMLSTFMAQTRLQSRILHETRALEQGFINSKIDGKDFEITVIARPKSAKIEKQIQESIDARQTTSSGEDRSEVETDSTST